MTDYIRDLLTDEPPFTTGEVASIFNVNPKTVTRWAQSNRITSFRTPGGHRRYRADDIRALAVSMGLRIERKMP